MSLRSPLGRVLGLGSARSGHEHWWQQRLTAVALAPLGLWFAWNLLGIGAFDPATVSHWIAGTGHAVLLTLLLLTLLLHSNLGLQVVVEDYVHGDAPRVALLVALRFAHAAAAVAGVWSIVVIALGARA